MNTQTKATIPEVKAMLKRAIEAHERMKLINKFYRKRGTCKGFPGLPEKAALELDARATNKANIPFHSRELERSNADITRLKVGLMTLQDQQVDAAEADIQEKGE